MCVICIAVDRKPTYDQVHKMYEDNSHGASISWFNSKGKAQYIKGLDKKELFKVIFKTPLPFVLHFRQSSFWQDRENKLLNHPFIISPDSPLSLEGEADKLLIHNGTIKEYELMLAVANIPKSEEPMSDTRAIAMIMAKMGDDKLPWRIPGKFVILDGTKKAFRLNSPNNFTHEDGMLFSNLSWKFPTNNYSYHKAWHHSMSDAEIFAYLDKEDKIIDVGTEDAQKKNSQTTQIEQERKKKTQKITTPSFKKDGEIIVSINNEMSIDQYNAGTFYRPPDKAESRDFYAYDGMKERRRWWKFVYNEHLFFEQKKIENYVTDFRCCECHNNLNYLRVKNLMTSGYKVPEYLCIGCEAAKKKSISTVKMTNSFDNWRSKTSRIFKDFSPCCCS